MLSPSSEPARSAGAADEATVLLVLDSHRLDCNHPRFRFAETSVRKTRVVFMAVDRILEQGPAKKLLGQALSELVQYYVCCRASAEFLTPLAFNRVAGQQALLASLELPLPPALGQASFELVWG